MHVHGKTPHVDTELGQDSDDIFLTKRRIKLVCGMLMPYNVGNKMRVGILGSKVIKGSVLLRGVQQKYAKNSHFKNFESALYSTSVRMPVRWISILNFV